VLVFVRHADDPQPVIADGRVARRHPGRGTRRGRLRLRPALPIPELGKTTAELAPDEKNRLSHRGQALRALVEKLK
jgi:XTP/dITP diphosphohydrolase